MAEISCGLYFFPRTSTQASPLSPLTILYGAIFMVFCTSGSSKRRPMRRLTAKMVFSGLVMAWRRAIWPTNRSPLSVNATTEGVMRLPSELVMTTGSPPSRTATHEFVVPRSIPITLGIVTFSSAGALITALGVGKVGRAFGYAHQSRAQQAVVQAIARLVLPDDGVGLVLGTLDVGDGFVVGRVEAGTLGFHPGHPVTGQDVQKCLEDQGN